MIADALRAALVADAGVKAITTRCYPVRQPQKPTYPLILYMQVSGWREQTLTGPAGQGRPRFQVEAWAETYEGVQVLSEAIKTALDGKLLVGAGKSFRAMYLTAQDVYEPDVNVFYQPLDFSLWYDF